MAPSLSRRNLLKLGAAGGFAMALPLQSGALRASGIQRMPQSKMPKPFTVRFATPPTLGSSGTYGMKCWDGRTRNYRRYDVRQQFTVAEIMPGFQTPFFGYNGVTPGPTIRCVQGKPIAVFQRNGLHQPPAPPYENSPMPSKYTNDPWQRSTSTHLHGSATLPMWDGYASDITFPGQTKLYFYPNSQNARTIWYHDHGVHHTSQNAYNGLAGMYILHDEVEKTLGLPTGAPGADPSQRRYDVPLVVRDAMFADNGQLLYDDNSESGAYGDVLLANGLPWPRMVVEPRLYRFRILNASVSRSYDWQLHDGRSVVPMTVVGTDAGLVHEPQVVSSFRHGMAERYEIVVDFSDYAGATITWRNLGPDNNVDYETSQWLMQFKVLKADRVRSTVNNAIPTYWNDVVHPHECMTWTEQGLLADKTPVRPFLFHRSNGQWTDQRRDLGGRDRQRLPPLRGRDGRGRRRDLGAEEQVGRVVPPRAHPPRRLPGALAQRLRVPGHAPREGAQGRGLRGRERDGAGGHALQRAGRRARLADAPRPLHDALPQPGPRGPRHDGAVQRGRPRVRAGAGPHHRLRRVGRLSMSTTTAAPQAPAPGAGARPTHRAASRGRTVAVRLLVGALAAGTATFVVLPPLGVTGRSMEPTLRGGDRVLVDGWSVRLTGWHRGDVVVLEPPDGSGTASMLVKRIVGVGGDTVAIRDGVLVVDGVRVDEAYADPDRIDSVYFGPVRVPAGHVFLLGDNRLESVDSRDFGTVPASELSGRVVGTVWPLDRIGVGTGEEER